LVEKAELYSLFQDSFYILLIGKFIQIFFFWNNIVFTGKSLTKPLSETKI